MKKMLTLALLFLTSVAFAQINCPQAVICTSSNVPGKVVCQVSSGSALSWHYDAAASNKPNLNENLPFAGASKGVDGPKTECQYAAYPTAGYSVFVWSGATLKPVKNNYWRALNGAQVCQDRFMLFRASQCGLVH